MKKLIIILVLVLFSCDIPYIQSEYSSSHSETLEYLYNQIEDHYVYTDFKEIDLKARYNYYDSIITNRMGDEEFFFYISSFLNELKDGHSNIVAPFGRSSYYDDIIGNNTDAFNPNYNSHVIDHYYLSNNLGYEYQILDGAFKSGIILGDDGSNYGYIYYPSFMNGISEYEIEKAIDRFNRVKVKGVILDIRSNGGGSLTNMVTLVSYFGYNLDKKSTKVAKVWRKVSSSKFEEISSLEVAPFISVPFTIEREGDAYTGDVALLTNRGSYSASSFTATAFKNFSNVKQIGTATGGGMGLPIGGYLPNGWTYRLSGNVTLSSDAPGISSINDKNYNWEDGVPADIYIEDDLTTTDKDEIIDRAIQWFNR